MIVKSFITFGPSLVFVGKSGAYPIEEQLQGASLG
jgi:hypothetical protein